MDIAVLSMVMSQSKAQTTAAMDAAQAGNARLNSLAEQVRALDSESRRNEDRRILE